jgi:hypothetical protein
MALFKVFSIVVRLPGARGKDILSSMGMESPETAERLMTPTARMVVVGKS